MSDLHLMSGIATLLLVLVVGTLFGRLHSSDSAEVKATGDRVACGLLAIPLISLAVRLAFPTVPIGWALAAPLPLLTYVVLLAGTDLGWAISRRYFTATLVGISATIYGAMSAFLLFEQIR